MKLRSNYYHTPKSKEIIHEAQKRYEQTPKGKAARKRVYENQKKRMKEDPEYRGKITQRNREYYLKNKHKWKKYNKKKKKGLIINKKLKLDYKNQYQIRNKKYYATLTENQRKLRLFYKKKLYHVGRLEYQEFKKRLKLERGNKCERCNKNGKKHSLLIHHKISVTEQPIFLMTDWNCFVLCHGCHKIIHLYPNKNKSYFTPPNNIKTLDSWIEDYREES